MLLDRVQVKAFGVQEAMSVCRELLAKGHRSLHFYTMNLEAAVTQVIDGTFTSVTPTMGVYVHGLYLSHDPYREPGGRRLTSHRRCVT